MKADPHGTPVEQARARMGWKPRAQILADGGDLSRSCASCTSRWLKRVQRKDGGVDFSTMCGHCQAGGIYGHTTRESATCRHWEPRP